MFNNKGTLDTEGELRKDTEPSTTWEGRERKGGKREEMVGTGEKKEIN